MTRGVLKNGSFLQEENSTRAKSLRVNVIVVSAKKVVDKQTFWFFNQDEREHGSILQHWVSNGDFQCTVIDLKLVGILDGTYYLFTKIYIKNLKSNFFIKILWTRTIGFQKL
jgi:hypothetical protein